MKVYIVEHGDYEDCGVVAVFSTKELAEKYVAEYLSKSRFYKGILEFELDKIEE